MSQDVPWFHLVGSLSSSCFLCPAGNAPYLRLMAYRFGCLGWGLCRVDVVLQLEHAAGDCNGNAGD